MGNGIKTYPHSQESTTFDVLFHMKIQFGSKTEFYPE